MFKKLYEFMADTSGATGIEYGLLVGGISVVVSTGAFLIGDQFNAMFDGLSVYMDQSTSVK